MTEIQSIGMPKWGLSMKQGQVGDWLVDEGEELSVGDDVLEVETEKINGVVEAPVDGVVRRIVAKTGDVVPVGGLLAVVAPAEVGDEEISAFVDDFMASFVPPSDDDEDESPIRTVDIDGRTISFAEYGDGAEAVVLLHGFGGDQGNWLFTAPALVEGRTVYALDLPGHGASSKDVGDGSLDVLARTVLGFLSAQGIPRAHLVGHSMGGLTAMAAAVAEPERVASLTLVAPAGVGEQMNGDYLSGFVSAGSRGQLKPVLAMLFADKSLVTRQLCDDVLKYKRLDGVTTALQTLSVQLFPDGRQAHQLGSEVANLDVPILVVWGAEDQVIPASQADQAPAGARVEVIEGAGHQPHMEKANDVNRILGEFIAGIG